MVRTLILRCIASCLELLNGYVRVTREDNDIPVVVSHRKLSDKRSLTSKACRLVV